VYGNEVSGESCHNHVISEHMRDMSKKQFLATKTMKKQGSYLLIMIAYHHIEHTTHKVHSRPSYVEDKWVEWKSSAN